MEQILNLCRKELDDGIHPNPGHDVRDLVSNSFGYEELFADFLIVCQDLMRSNPFDTGNKEALMKAVDTYIQENLSMPLTTKLLSSKFGLVAPYLSKLFKDYKGVSPAQYLQDIRLMRAKKLLLDTPSAISSFVLMENSFYDFC